MSKTWLSFAMIVMAWFMTSDGIAHADDSKFKQTARQIGHDVGTAAHKVGQEAKKAGKAIGRGAKKVGEAAKEGGKEFARAVKGQ